MNSLAYSTALMTFPQEARTTSAYYAAIDVGGYLDRLEQAAHECEMNDESLTDFRLLFLSYRDDALRYDQILAESVERSNLLQRYILNTLATLDYHDIKESEEEYVLRHLEFGDLSLQEAALGTIIDWDGTKNLEKLKTVRIKNYYLQKDLNDFVGRLEDA